MAVALRPDGSATPLALDRPGERLRATRVVGNPHARR
jgi:hypothetical protein